VKARLRTLLIVALSVLGLLVLSVLILLHSTFGARMALKFAGDAFTYRSVEGSLAGPLHIEGLHYRDASVELRADQLSVDANLLALLGGKLSLAALAGKGLQVERFADAAATAESTSEPSALPKIEIRSLALDDARLVGFAGAPVVIERVRGSLTLGPEHLAVEKLDIDTPQADLALQLDAQLRTRVGKIAFSFTPKVAQKRFAPLQFDLKADGRRVDYALKLPEQYGSLIGSLDELDGALNFQAQLISPGVLLESLGFVGLPALPAHDLRIVGDRTQARLEGNFTLAGQSFKLDGSRITFDATRLGLKPLRLQQGGSQLSAEGDIALSDQQAELKVSWQQLNAKGWLSGPLSALASPSGALTISGHPLAFLAQGEFGLALSEHQAEATVAVSGDATQIVVQQLQLKLAEGGSLKASGRIKQDGSDVDAKLQLSEFELTPWVPEWPGVVSAELALRQVGDQLDIALASLDGEVRGRPLKASAALGFRKREPQANSTLTVDWGEAQLAVRIDDQGAYLGRLALDSLALLEPEASGSIQADFDLNPQQQHAAIKAQGTGLRVRDHAAQGMTLELKAAQAADAPLKLLLELTDAQVNGLAVQSANLSMDGSLKQHRFDLAAQSQYGGLELGAEGSWLEDRWRGTLQKLLLAPKLLASESPWRLQAPAALALGDGLLSLGASCLAQAQAEVCIELEQRQDELAANAKVRALPLALAQAFVELPDVVLAGSIDGALSLTQNAAGMRTGEGSFSARDAKVTWLRDEKDFVLELDRLQSTLSMSGEQLQAKAEADIAKLGTLTASFDASGSQVRVDFPSLEALNGLSPELTNIRGKLQGVLAFAEQPSGSLSLQDAAVELPALGTRYQDITLVASAASDAIAIDASMRGGEGSLKARGQYRLGVPQPLELEVSGSNFLAADLPQARAVISPELKVQSVDALTAITGTIDIPDARFDLARFEPLVASSPDVIDVEAQKPSTQAPLPLRVDVRFALGERVTLKGFGLNGAVKGRMRVRERPGRPSTARGEITVQGTYKAYGQDLQIERGRLLFANSALDNPGLDIRAVRVIGKIKAGVQVRGSAELPELTTYSDPAMSQIDAISYLVLGRPASEARGSGGDAVQNAAQQLGGNLLAKSVGQRLGLEVGFENSAELGGGSAFTVGKFLSPKLYVGYGRSLFDAAQLFIVRYKLTDRYELEGLSGREQKAGVNYRLER
jgi:translocation and assembly module TamB